MKKLSTFCISLVCFTLVSQAQIWQPLNDGLSYAPSAITVVNEKRLVVAYKVQDNGSKGNTLGLAFWNGGIWQRLPNVDCDSGSRISALYYYKSHLYIGGKFGRFGKLSNARNLVRWTGKEYQNVQSPSTAIKSTDVITHFNIYDDLLVVGGRFPNTVVSGGDNLGFYNGEKWVSSGIKELEKINNTVLTTFVKGNDFYVGGFFTKVGFTKTSYMARFRNGELAAFGHNVVRPWEFVSTTSRLIVAGSLKTGPLPTKFYEIVNDSAYEMENGFKEVILITDLVSDGKIAYASGKFKFPGSDDFYYIAKYEDETWSPFEGGFLSNVHWLTIYKESLIATGSFKTHRDIKINRIAQFKNKSRLSAIRGQVYFDKNMNCKKDPRDEFLTDRVIRIEPGNILVRPREDGFYTVYLEEGNYEISIVPGKYWRSSPCSKLKQTVELNNGVLDTIDFPLVQESNIKDLAIKLVSSSGSMVNLNNRQQYFINYENLGSSELVAGTVSLKFDSRLKSLKAIPKPDRVFGDSAVWDVMALSPGETGEIKCLFDVDGSVEESLELTATIAQKKIEDDIENNTSSLTQQIVDEDIDIHKFVNPDGTTSDTAYLYPDADYIQYHISFSNYTEDTVRNVYIIDTIALNSSIKSINDISFSHPIVDGSYPGPAFSNYYVLVYKFEDINLPPNPTRNGEIVTDEGHATFELALKNNLTDGLQFVNTATVVFDYAFEKETNTVMAIVDEDLVSAPKLIMSEATLYPNPTEGLVYLDQNSEHYTDFKVFTMNGSQIAYGPLNGSSTVDLSSFEPGIYILQLDSDNASYRTKVVKW